MAAIMVYVYAHLGLSFVLAAALATPGCEMRGIPHLVGLLRGRSSGEHYCPGFIDGLDRWERERRLPKDQRTPNRARPDDWIGSWRGVLSIYGIPWLAIQLAGNLAGARVVAIIWSVSFAFMGLACVANAFRSGRVHCWFVGPWFLLAAAITILRFTGAATIPWPTIVNAGLLGALLLFFVSENLWGRYFGRRTYDTA